MTCSAMLLAAGRGSRLRPLTDTLPKPMVQVKGKPLIVYHIEKLARLGIKNIVINISYLAEKIQDALQDGSAWGVNIAYSYESEPLETGGGIVKALPVLGDKPFLVISSDIFTAYDFKNLCYQAKYFNSLRLAHLVLVPNPTYYLNGDFSLMNSKIKPKNTGLLGNHPEYTYASMGIFHPDFFKERLLEKFPLVSLLRAHIDQQQVTGELYSGQWHNIGSIRELEKVSHIF